MVDFTQMDEAELDKYILDRQEQRKSLKVELHAASLEKKERLAVDKTLRKVNKLPSDVIETIQKGAVVHHKRHLKITPNGVVDESKEENNG